MFKYAVREYVMSQKCVQHKLFFFLQPCEIAESSAHLSASECLLSSEHLGLCIWLLINCTVRGSPHCVPLHFAILTP
jgi:hypothetical protein